jgi:hypothetical protein
MEVTRTFTTSNTGSHKASLPPPPPPPSPLTHPGGRTVYLGPVGEGGKDLISYLHSIPATPPIEPHEQPQTWMLREWLSTCVCLCVCGDMGKATHQPSSLICHPLHASDSSRHTRTNTHTREHTHVNTHTGCIGAGTQGVEKADYAFEYNKSALCAR